MTCVCVCARATLQMATLRAAVPPKLQRGIEDFEKHVAMCAAPHNQRNGFRFVAATVTIPVGEMMYCRFLESTTASGVCPGFLRQRFSDVDSSNLVLEDLMTKDDALALRQNHSTRSKDQRRQTLNKSWEKLRELLQVTVPGSTADVVIGNAATDVQFVRQTGGGASRNTLQRYIRREYCASDCRFHSSYYILSS